MGASLQRPAFPFFAVAGMDRARQALLFLAVDPGLKGVLLAAGAGTAKTVLARGIQPFIQPFVEAPAGLTEDRLIGGLDLERTLLTGRREIADGLLAQAHRGVLYVDQINLLDRSLARHIVTALNDAVIHIEREGLSVELPSEFGLIATYDPSQGEISESLMDSVALHVTETRLLSSAERVEMLNRVAAFDRDPFGFAEQHAGETARLSECVAAAREQLPQVDISLEHRRRLCMAALGLGVEGHRAEMFAVRLARVCAAWQGCASVREEHVQTAIELVILPRARVLSQMRPTVAATRSEPTEASRELSDLREGEGLQPQPTEDRILEALDSHVPEELLEIPRSSTPERLRAAGRRKKNAGDTISWNRGRYVRAVARKPEGGKVAIEATLRAAAARPKSRDAAIRVSAGDLRFKQFKQKHGMLVVFVVDASGSMALNRMSLAKGAILRLLQKSYLQRDRVALISFRGDRADVLLHPSRSVELAKRALDGLPVGGGTPLAAGLHAALDLTRRASHAGAGQILMVLLTDGNANVAADKEQAIWPELERVCASLRFEGINSVVIDTSSRFVAGRGAERLAELLGGRHASLPLGNAAAVFDTVAAFAGEVRTA